MTTSLRIPALLAAAAVCAGLAACGDDDVGDPISDRKAARLQSQLDTAQAEINQGACDDALGTIDDARAVVDTLDDDGVGSDVQDALGDGIDHLRNLAIGECEEEEEVETTPETVTEPPPPTTETAPPPTTDTTPTPTEPEPAPEPDEDDEESDEGDGSGQFGPGGISPGQQKKLERDTG